MTVLQAAGELDPGSRELALQGLVFLLASLSLSPLAVTLARRFTPRMPVFFARWRFLHATLVGLLLALAWRLIPPLVQSLPGSAELPEGLRALFGSALALGVTSLAILWIAARLDPDGIASLGLRASGSLRAALVGAACYALMFPGIQGVQLLWPWLLERLGGEYKVQEIAQAVQALGGDALVLGGILVIFVQPLLEELIFRGFLQPLLVQNLGDRGGVFLASLIFAVLHGDSAFLPVFALALLLGSLKLRTQRLAACVAVHALHNGIAFLTLDTAARL